jgi:hypothetical protein
MRITVWLIVGALAVSLGGCPGGPDDPELRGKWDKALQDGHNRSNYDCIFASWASLGGGSIDGFRMWQGDYRGVPIALYSCGYHMRMAGEMGWISIILTVEDNRKVPPDGIRRRMVVRQMAERRFEPREIDADKLLTSPGRSNSWDVGQVHVEVRDEGGGKLGFRMDPAKEPRWESFDLEKVLKDEHLAGPLKVTMVEWPKYTREEFAKAMIARFERPEMATDPIWNAGPESFEKEPIDHPVWEDPEAVKQLLTTAPTEPLLCAISVIVCRAGKDGRYLLRLESIQDTLLGLLSNPSPEVRAKTAGLLGSELWPRDVHVLEPFLMSPDPKVQVKVLRAFETRKTIPFNLARVRELTHSPDEIVQFYAEEVLDLLKPRERL